MEININLPSHNSNSTWYDDLSNVWVLDYGDNYHKRDDEPMSDLERDVRKLKGRYRDLIKYNQALIIYDEWMSYLSDRYGGSDILKKMIKNGLVDEYVPRKPRLKNSKTLKYLYKHKILVSSLPSGGKIKDDDAFDKYMERYFPEDEYVEPQFNIVKDKIANKISAEYDTSPYFKSYSFASDAQYLEQYFSSKNKPKKKDKSKGKKKKEDPILLKDIIDGVYKPDPNAEDESDNAYVRPYGTLLLSGSRTKEMEMYHKLNEAGWNSYKIMKNAKYSKRERDMFKPIKKAKKKKKKRTEKMMKQLGVEDSIVQIINDMGYDDFEDYQREMLSMTSDDLFD